MGPNIGRLLGADERLHHQITDTFATISESDLAWTEKIWVTIPRKDGSLQIDFGLGRYHNRDVLDGFAGISRGNEQWTLRASRELSPDVESTAVGPLTYEVIEPLKKVRYALGKNDILPLMFDVTFEGVMKPFLEDRHLQRDENGLRIVSDIIRYHQGGKVSGWVEIDGKRETINSDDWYAFRDHSWGVRLDVGAHVTDLRPSRAWGDTAFGQGGFLLHWCPMVLTRPDGSTYAYHYYLQSTRDKPIYFSGYLNHADGSQDRVGRVRPMLQYDRVTRRPKGGTIHYDMLNGENRAVEVEVVGDSGFHLGPALYLGFDGKKHGNYRGKLNVEGEKIANTRDPATLPRIHQVRDNILRVREGDAVGYGIIETILVGAWKEYGLDDEVSYI
jgi:hypothetical protein